MEWLSVKDRLPDKGKEILVYGVLEYSKIKGIHLATFYDVEETKSGNTTLVEVFWQACCAYDVVDVTHWMPLPDVPEEK